MKTRINFVKRFLIGFGSIFNIFPVYNAPADIPINADLHFLQSDWKAIGRDFNKSLSRVKRGLK